jgi:hypothetical protein
MGGTWEMDDLLLYWHLFGWLWAILQRPDFVLCIVIGVELIYQMKHDRQVSAREERRLEQERENIRRERGYKLLGLWYRQVGGGHNAHWLQSFEERHEYVKVNPNTVGPAIFADWKFVEEMVASFVQLRPLYAEYLDFEAANTIITHDWASLDAGVSVQKLADWDWGIKRLEEVRQKDILPVTDCFMGLTVSLLGTWEPDPYDATKLRADHAKKGLPRNGLE